MASGLLEKMGQVTTIPLQGLFRGDTLSVRPDSYPRRVRILPLQPTSNVGSVWWTLPAFGGLPLNALWHGLLSICLLG